MNDSRPDAAPLHWMLPPRYWSLALRTLAVLVVAAMLFMF